MDSSNKLKFLGFAGSLSVGSYNKALLSATIDLLPKDVYLEIFEIDGIPLFNQDIEKDIQIENKGCRCHPNCNSRV